MSTRSFVLLSILASTFTLSPAVLADVPASTSSSSSSSSGGTGGSGSSTNGTGGSDPNCQVDVYDTTGVTCQTCNPNSTCASLDSSFNLACTQSKTVQVWCNGPDQSSPSDQGASGCSVRAGHAGSSDSWKGGLACGALALAAAVYLRKKR